MVFLHVFAGVKSPNAKHDRPKARKVAALKIVWGQRGDVQADLLQNDGNIVSRSHEVADLQSLRDLHLHNAGTLQRGLVIEEAAKIGPRNQTVAFAVVA